MNTGPGLQAFVFSEYIALSLAKVWAGRAKIPEASQLWRVHNQTVRERGGYGKKFMFLGLANAKGESVLVVHKPKRIVTRIHSR